MKSRMLSWGMMMVLVLGLLSSCTGKPGWVKSEDTFFAKDDHLFFRGEVHGPYDLALGKRQAEADAKKRLVEMVRSEVRVEFRELTRGANVVPDDVGRFVEDLIDSTADVRVSGITALKSYWEPNPEPAAKESARPPYAIYALLRIERKDFEDAKRQMIGALLEQSRLDQSKKAEELLREWKQRRER